MEAYKTRNIRFKKVEEIGDWKIKVYTITKQGEFDHSIFYKEVLERLPDWLQMDNGFENSNEGIGFLILHEGTEGIFSLVNWWVGDNMLNTHIFLSNPAQPSEFKLVSGNGLSPCVWELEIINHERVSWTKNVLQKHLNPGFDDYLKDTIEIDL